MLVLITIINAEPNQDFTKSIDQKLLNEFRHTYYSGVENEEFADSLQNLLSSSFGSDTSNYPAIALAYKAGVIALRSKHAFWPFSKMSYLNESMDIFAEAIDDDPNNLEIRFMRFSILYYVPGILGYDEEEEKDLNKVFELLLNKDFSTIDFELQEGMAEFLIESDLLTVEQERALQSRFMLAKNE